ncbi:MAG: tetraacyldisaccharide 4'-kinase, partial [Alloprevotella sp.]|nr:tetraacyldisaccharide 4'-kinase [Alloprevotella sp.]
MNRTLSTCLLPLSWVYGAVMEVRNRLFERHLLPSVAFPVPVIAVGNLAVGGSGKTPHTELLLRLLAGHRVAVLSRGYGRATRGFRLVSTTDSAQDTGDEPLQMKRKFPAATVAVDGNRRRGIARLLESDPALEFILLDDAFQHRYVRPAISILLTDYSRRYTGDRILPAGRLRERAQGAARADIIIVTKCPPTLTPEEAAALRKE